MKQKSIFVQFYLILTLLLIPAAGINEGLKYFAENRKKIEISSAARELTGIRNDLQLHADQQKFWVNQLKTWFSEAESPLQFADRLKEFLSRYQSEVVFAVYDKHSRLVSDNFILDPAERTKWDEAGISLQTAMTTAVSPKYYEAVDRLRSVMGRNLFVPTTDNPEFNSCNILYQNDFEKDLYRCWLAKNSLLMAVVRISTKELQKKTGLKAFISTLDPEKTQFESFSESEQDFDRHSATSRIAYQKLLQQPAHEFIEYENKLFSRAQTGINSWVLITYQLSDKQMRPGRIVVAGLLLLIFFILFLQRNGWFPARIENLPLLVQTGILMAVAAGIPLTILGSVAINYFANKKTALIREVNQQMAQFALNIDRNLELEHSRYARMMRQSMHRVPDMLSDKTSSNDIRLLFRERLDKAYSSMLILAGRVLRDSSEAKAEYSLITHDMHPSDKDIISHLGKRHLATLNSTAHEDIPPEIAYLLETVFQKPFEQIVHDLLSEEGKLVNAGWGSRKLTLFVESFQLLTSAYFDHFLFMSIHSDLLQESYIARHLHGAIRNPWGFIFYVAYGQTLLNEQKPLEQYPDVNRLFTKTADFPLPEPEIVEFNNSSHLFVGLKGSTTNSIRFCVLYPVERIDAKISGEAKELIYPTVLGISLVFFMIVILHLNLLMPVKRLHQAARALENRDSTFRLPDSEGDEFSEMAKIFNNSIGEFDELKIASIVQARLLPNQPFNVEGFSIFGKSLPMIELGGDYFDYFPIDEMNFALLLGDVAGHGVGASLIMAMAKAGVICSNDIARDPASVLGRLHQIVFSIKNRVQRKVMTFQYLLVNKIDRSLVYSNAGGCSPALIDPTTKTVNEIKHAGAVLGGFKKSVYSNLNLTINPGQAIILYTDGMVESRNEIGTELGYQGLFDLFLACYDKNATIYYHNVMTSYQKWLGQAVAGDDVTLIVMVCT